MFFGEYRNRMDAKGRLMIPARFREVLADEETMILKPGLDGCLLLLPLSVWEVQARLIRDALPPTSSESRYLRRRLLVGAEACSPDSLGRIVMPQALREHAGLRREAVILGMVDYAEIWSREKWGEYLSPRQAPGDIEAILERVAASLPRESLRFL